MGRMRRAKRPMRVLMELCDAGAARAIRLIKGVDIRRLPHKRIALTALAFALLLLPGMRTDEEGDVMRLAKTLYAIARYESRETMIAIGSVAMNRVASGVYPPTLREVLDAGDGFYRGAMYDGRTVAVAREVMMGARNVAPDVLHFSQTDPVITVGGGENARVIGGFAFF